MSLNKIIKKIAGVKVFFFAVFWLMILLTIGTIVQKDIGLYQAQVQYFSSWIVWFWGVIPTPGGQLTMGVIFIGLTAKLLVNTPLHFRNLGIAITHLGAFLLILGGIITGYLSFEGSMVIDEGETVSYFQDYHKLELALTDPSPKEYDQVYTFAQGFLRKGEVLEHQEVPFKIEVIDFCRNCTYVKRTGRTAKYHGFTKNFKLKAIALSKEDSQNRSGITFKVTGSTKDGIYAIFEDMQINQSLTSAKASNKKYFIQLRQKRYNLPFKLELLDFDKTDYAATSMAKSYKSVVNLLDEKVKQRTVIQMNEPLRYKGYTLYQSSYIQGGMGRKETTILSVVHNMGRMFPYISSIIICIGIVIHLLIISGMFKHAVRKED